MNFQETGNKIPISSEELINYVQYKLEEYDSLLSKHKFIPPSIQNPYTHPIIYETQDGKTIRIPDEIQKQVIHSWYQNTGNNIPVMQQSHQMPKVYQSYQDPETQEIDSNSTTQENDYGLLKIGVWILIAILAIFLFYKMTNKSSTSSTYTMDYDQLKYYLSK